MPANHTLKFSHVCLDEGLADGQAIIDVSALGIATPLHVEFDLVCGEDRLFIESAKWVRDHPQTLDAERNPLPETDGALEFVSMHWTELAPALQAEIRVAINGRDGQ